MKSPFSIQTFFPTGEINDYQICQIPTRVIQAFLIPREQLKYVVSERIELSWTGLYFLFSEKENNSLNGDSKVYIGESENVGVRLKKHVKSKDDWEVAVVFTTNNEANQLTKSDIKFLENQCYAKCLEANRFVLGQTIPTKSFATEAREADLNDIFETISLYASYLGYPLFRQKPSDEKNEGKELLYFSGRGSTATGWYTKEGLTVQKGSVIATKSTKGFKREALLQRLIEQTVLDKSGNFLKSYTFSSPSTAASVVGRASYNGWKVWKNNQGITLDDLYKRP